MFIKTTESSLVNLDALAEIKADGFNVIARGRDVVHDSSGYPYTRTYTLGFYHSIMQAINAMHDLEESIAAQSPLHEMTDPDDGAELLKEVVNSTAHTETITDD